MMINLPKYRLAGKLKTPVSGKLLYLMLLDNMDSEGRFILSQRRMSEALGISKTTIRRNLRKLYHAGQIDILPRWNEDGGRASNKIVVRR